MYFLRCYLIDNSMYLFVMLKVANSQMNCEVRAASIVINLSFFEIWPKYYKIEPEMLPLHSSKGRNNNNTLELKINTNC